MKIAVLPEMPFVPAVALVRTTYAGNVIEQQTMSRMNTKQTVKMLPGGNQFEILSTGEIKDVNHYANRKDGYQSLKRTFENIRNVINANVRDVSRVRWCTLTYAENMTDPKRLYEDFKKFNMRFQTFCKNHNWSIPEYIVIMEPQNRGAWHGHLLYIWQDMTAPYISNAIFAKLWGHGFVTIKKLKNCDNIGAYLTAYLGDMSVEECLQVGIPPVGKEIKDVEIVDEKGEKIKKSFIKGARLVLYPPKFNMFRCSRGVKRAFKEYTTAEEARKKVLGATKTFERAFLLTDEEKNFECTILKEQYNKIRR